MYIKDVGLLVPEETSEARASLSFTKTLCQEISKTLNDLTRMCNSNLYIFCSEYSIVSKYSDCITDFPTQCLKYISNSFFFQA